MNYNHPSEIVKDLTFGEDARNKILSGVDKLYKAVKSTLGASGKTVIYEDALGQPVITKDGVTVAQSVVLLDPVESMGATLIKQAAQNTVREAGDGTTTSTVLAHALLSEVYKYSGDSDVRSIKRGIDTAFHNVVKYLDKIKIDVNEKLLEHVAKISTNNDQELGSIIGEAFNKVGKQGVVLLEDSGTNETYLDVIDGAQIECGLTSQHLITDKESGKAVLETPCILIMGSPVPNVRKIQSVLEHVVKQGRPLLIVGAVEQQPTAALLSNKVKGNIKVNIIDAPGFGSTRPDTLEDLAIMTGARVINEELGDDIDFISPEDLGEAQKVITDDRKTIITLNPITEKLTERIEHVQNLIDNEKDNPFIKKRLEERMALLTGNVAVVYVGADSQVELKEKRDRVEDAIYATKAALQEGIVPGGGIALLNAAHRIKHKTDGEKLLLNAICKPWEVILDNAGFSTEHMDARAGWGLDVSTGKNVNMLKAGIIDPVLVTKTALKNAISVTKTIISSDCVISNIRVENASN